MLKQKIVELNIWPVTEKAADEVGLTDIFCVIWCIISETPRVLKKESSHHSPFLRRKPSPGIRSLAGIRTQPLSRT